MNDLNKKIFLIILSIVMAGTTTFAQVRVSKGAGQKSSIDLSGFAAGADETSQIFKRTLDSDLMRSGWFVRMPAGQAEFSISGSAEARGGKIRAECRAYGQTTQRSYLSKAYDAEINQPRRLAHQVADEIIEALTGRKGFASGQIAMVGTRSGQKELYLCDADGQNLVQLTRDKSVSVGPSWGPNGDRLVYTSYLKGFPDIYLIELASGARKRISNFSGLNTGAAIAPNGREMALILSKDGNPELYVKDLSAGTLTKISNTKRAAEASPSWSPDGSSIVYVSDQSGTPQLYITSKTGGAPKRLTSRGSQNVAPDWGSNGQIAYSSLIGGHYQICVINPATLEQKQLSLDGADYEDPSWVSDGRHIVCARSLQYRSKIYLLDVLGDPPISLTEYPGDWYSPAWSPKNK